MDFVPFRVGFCPVDFVPKFSPLFAVMLVTFRRYVFTVINYIYESLYKSKSQKWFVDTPIILDNYLNCFLDSTFKNEIIQISERLPVMENDKASYLKLKKRQHKNPEDFVIRTFRLRSNSDAYRFACRRYVENQFNTAVNSFVFFGLLPENARQKLLFQERLNKAELIRLFMNTYNITDSNLPFETLKKRLQRQNKPQTSN